MNAVPMMTEANNRSDRMHPRNQDRGRAQAKRHRCQGEQHADEKLGHAGGANE